MIWTKTDEAIALSASIVATAMLRTFLNDDGFVTHTLRTIHFLWEDKWNSGISLRNYERF